MKKKYFNKALTRVERKRLNRTKNTLQKAEAGNFGPLMVLLALTSRTVKGKLGFTITTADGIFLFNSEAIFNALTLNTGGYYSTPFNHLALLGTQNAAFASAISDVRLNVLGGEGAKKAAKKALKLTLDSALAYINELARTNQNNAVEIITGAKMMVIGDHSVNKQDFAVKYGDATAEVNLTALAEKVNGKYVKAIYDWQFSIDNGRTWENLPSTTKAKTIATGMLVGIATLFRKRTITVKHGTSQWCDAIQIIPL